MSGGKHRAAKLTEPGASKEPMDESEIERRKNWAAERIYTADFVSRLTEEFDILGSADIETLKRGLCYSAAVYQIQKQEENSELNAPDVDVKAELEKIQKRANALKQALDSMSAVTRDLYWTPLQYRPFEFYLAPHPPDFFGYPIYWRTLGEGKVFIEWPDEPRVTGGISFVANLARQAISRTQPDKGGRPKSEALRIWVINMQSLWEKGLGRPFSYSQHQGAPVSTAYRFCWQVLQPLDSTITVALLGTTMRAVISQTPKRLRLRKSRKAR